MSTTITTATLGAQSANYLASWSDLLTRFGSNQAAANDYYITTDQSVAGRSTLIFDAAAYLAAYSDLQAAFGNNLGQATRHWIEYGYNEGRSFLSAPTVSLTSNSETVEGTVVTGSNFNGMAYNDTFAGNYIGDAATGTTITPGDRLVGGAGVDTLALTVSGSANNANTITSAVTTDGVEKILVSNFDTNLDDTEDTTVDATLFTGVTLVGLSSSNATGDTIFTELGNVVDAQMASGSADLTVNYVSTLLTGATDTQNLTLKGATGGTFAVSNGLTGFAETLAINSTTAANTVTLADNHHTTVNITGDKALTLTLTDTATTTTAVNASAFTGNLTLSGLAGTQIAITGGTGNDTFVMANWDLNDTLNGGAGTDTIRTAATITAANAVGISNVEVLEVTGNGVTQAANIFSGITSVSVNDSTAGSPNGTTTFTNLAATTPLSIKAVGDTTDNVAATLATNTNADAITVSLGTATAGVGMGTLTLNNYETVTINNAFAASTIGSFVSTSVTSLNVNNTSSGVLTIAANTAAALTNVNASGSTKGVAFTGAFGNIAGVSITGGTGNDNFIGGGGNDTIDGGSGANILTGGAGKDSITGGSGIDSLTGGIGNDTLIGGAGNDIFADSALNNENESGGDGDDTFRIATFATLTSADTISGGAGTDTLAFGENTTYDFTADVTITSNVTGVEQYSFTGLAGSNDSVIVNDGAVSAAGGTLTLLNSSASSTTWNASNVLVSTSHVVFSSDATGEGSAQIYSVGNGIDHVTFGSAGDTLVVSNNAFLQSTDTLSGGTGSDTLSFVSATGSTITASQLSNVTGFESFNVTTVGGTGNYVFTLTDSIVGAQVAAGDTFTVTRNAADTGTIKITGSSVTANYNLALTGGAGADTLIGGAGNDILTGGAGVDSITGGAGSDTFTFNSSVGGPDHITDFTLATSGTSALTITDKIQLAALYPAAGFGGALTAVLEVTGTLLGNNDIAATDDVVILHNQSYASVLAAATDIKAGAGAADATSHIFIWLDNFNQVHVSGTTDATTAATAVDLAILDSVTLTGVATAITTATIGTFLVA